MKILVFAHQLEMGGTQVNAINFATTLRDVHGHDVTLFATPGPTATLAEENRLRYIAAPDAWIHPSPSRVSALRDLVRRFRPDIIHAWDWWQCLDAYYVEHLLMRVPLVVTDMMMTLTRVLPKALPTTFGTPELVDQARAAGRRCVELVVPPVDVIANAPDAVDAQPFRERCGIQEGDITLVTVSRLAVCMKSESLRRTIAAVRALGREFPLRFILVGEGEGRAELEQLASETNEALGRRAVILTGALLDPRPAYAAADIFVGMGGSALRAMAFGKPVIVVGEKGFSAALTPETATSFYYRGIYGLGDNAGNEKPVSNIRALVERRETLFALGEFSRKFVVQHFALDTVTARLEAFLQRAVAEMSPLHVATADGLRSAAVSLRERRLISYRFWERVRG